jgi:hypothetical protein
MSDASGDEGAQVIVIPLAPDSAQPRVSDPTIDAMASSYAGCIDIDAGMDAGLSFAGGQAARVTMADSTAAGLSIGRVTVAPEISGLVVGLPTVDTVDKSPAYAPDAAISNVRANGDGFLFDVTWSGRDPMSMCGMGGQPSWTFRVGLKLQCGGQNRVVESFTVVAVCGDSRWASSGDACDQCSAICEMAPSPLLPEKPGDDLPLGSALGVVVRPLVRVDGATVLLAEHAPRPGLRYAWQATAGTIEQLDADVVLWRLPADTQAEDHLVQVAITDSDLATVASYRWNRRAA